MNPKIKYILVGMVIGGFLPALFHPLEITFFVSVEDIAAHTIGAIIGIIIGLVIYKSRNK